MSEQQSCLAVRPFRAGDVPALIDIFRSAVRGVAVRDYTAAQVAAWAPDVIDPESWAARCAARLTFIADIGGVPAGFAEFEPDGHLDMMYVHAAHQGRGVARALLSRIESAARAAGIRLIRTEASITARPFFERHGFALIAPQTVSRRGQDFLNFRMSKAL